MEIQEGVNMGLGILRNRIKGLTAFQIKVFALVCMTLDHIAAYGFEIPVISRYGTYLRMIGRLAAPLFLFLLVQSIRHTRSKPKFLLRLYLAGMCVELFTVAMNLCFGEIFTYFTPGNIIYTFFYTTLYIILIERLASAWKTRNIRTLVVSIGVFMVSLIPTILFDTLYDAAIPAGVSLRVVFLVRGLYNILLPSFYSIDYGIGFVLLGVVMYFAKTKNRQCLVYAAFCAICIVGAYAAPYELRVVQSFGFFPTFFDRLQCHMVFALPIMLLYNGAPGRKCKWFFYGYYPLHRELLFILFKLAAP